MNVSAKRKNIEALFRLKELEEQFELRPNIYKYFKEGKLYYSYLIAGISGCIDTINYDSRYVKVVEEFENRYNSLVYHVIESGNTIALLYVSDCEEDWEMQRLFAGQYIAAYVYNFEHPDLSEYGDIVITCSEGALVRVG